MQTALYLQSIVKKYINLKLYLSEQNVGFYFTVVAA